ncbi:hypothetical protein C0J52_05425 [Blattella germanica]|nr:hypothetical protein C0J52_05425 [Blattella germanica]
MSTLLLWASLYDSEAGSDVEFIVGPEKWRFPGHRAVLSAANPVFQALLDGPMATHDNTIPIEDVDGRAFDNVLRYLYKEKEVQLQSTSTALHTLYAAFKYHCWGLVQKCVQYLDSQLDCTSVLEIYSHVRIYSDPVPLPAKDTHGVNTSPQRSPAAPSAPPMESEACGGYSSSSSSPTAAADEVCDHHHSSNEDMSDAMSCCGALHHNCLQYIDIYASKIVEQEQVEDLDLKALRLIAERETLNLSSEIILFDALDRWCNRECKRRRLELSQENRRGVLGQEILFSVRYLLMSSEEFLQGPMQSGLLDQNETAVMLAHILRHNPPPITPSHLEGVLMKMKVPRCRSSEEPFPLSWRSTPRLSRYDALTSGDGSIRGSGRRWGKKKDGKKLRKQKGKSCSPDREGLDRHKRSTGSCIVEYVFSALSCVFD